MAQDNDTMMPCLNEQCPFNHESHDLNCTFYDIHPTAEFGSCHKYTATRPDAKDSAAELAKLIHYPECWDTAAYPTLDDAIHEALAWSGCSVCKGGKG